MTLLAPSRPAPARAGRDTPVRTRSRLGLPFLLALALTTALLGLSLATGEYSILSHDDGWELFRTVRIPRTIALVLSGAAMSLSGLVMQLITQNRFVEPTTTGTTEWAGLGLLTVMIVAPHATILSRMAVAVGFAFIGTMVFFLLLRRVSLRSSLLVPIMGIMLGAVVSAVSTFLALETNSLQSLGVWFQGSFTSVYRGQYEVLWLVLLAVAAVVVLADRLTVAGLGEDVATAVGVSYQQMVLIATALIALATGVVTVVVGSLPFLGLIVPNLVSMARGDDLRSNLPWVCLSGTALVTVCDLVARTIISPFEVPVSVVLGVIGAAVFIVLIVRRTRRSGA
ncbi:MULTISPECIES: ABC transporter permease [Actinomyces]|uniref:Iron chelate uptake ABC transporter family permease subunit n=1 Tax=Actinomyces respiraculi TaxID=2744574 RepID=A0A7T0LKZ9_9ACTO|nr:MULTISPECIES: iron chelate uptake ABC transporter family permease subunit [Actinomyces]QPL05088.1 iron chelate uptake ABC transporter family permease subunit [Actinomyces respiraculi]